MTGLPRHASREFEPATTTTDRVTKAFKQPGAVTTYLRETATETARNIRRDVMRYSANGEPVKREIQGSTMRLHLDDSGIATDLALDGIREPAATRCYQRELRRRDAPTVVDIGANIGYYALIPASLDHDAQIIAIEPDPRNVARLRANVERNGYTDQFDIVQGAVGEESGEATLHRSTKSNCHTLNAVDGHDYTDEIETSVDPLPVILGRFNLTMADVDVLRMDVEGFELDILRGIDDLPKDCLVNVEIHTTLFDDAEFGELVDRLTPQGVTLHGAFYQGHSLPVDGLEGISDYVWAVTVFETRGGA